MIAAASLHLASRMIEQEQCVADIYKTGGKHKQFNAEIADPAKHCHSH